MTTRSKKVGSTIGISVLVLFMLPFLADPSGCTKAQPERDVWIRQVRCPFAIASETQTIETDRGRVVLGEQWWNLEPPGEPCPGHVVEVRR